MNRKRQTQTAGLLAIILVVGLAVFPLWRQTGLVNTRGGGDSPFLLQRTQQLVTAIADGHFPVRWMPDGNYGYGYPFFNFYAPLSIYIGAAFHFLGFGFVTASKMAQTAAFWVAAWGMYTLVRGWFGGENSEGILRQGEIAGILAAAAYTLAPFHLVNVYVRGDSLAELWAMAFYPLTLLAVDKLVGKQEGKGVWAQGNHFDKLRTSRMAFLALSYAGLILSHNISALIFSPFLLLYIFLRIIQKSNKLFHFPFPIFHSLLLGLALSAWFWLPALMERDLAQLEPVTSGYFHYSNHFRGLNLVQNSWLFDFEVADGNAFRMGLVQGFLILLGVIFVVWRLIKNRRNWHHQTHWLFALIAFLIATFMITPWSAWLWANLPLLNFTQFPWRFLSVQAFMGAILIAGIAGKVSKNEASQLGKSTKRLPKILSQLTRPYSLLLTANFLLLVSSLATLRPDYLPLTDDEITPERLASYEWFTGNIGTTVSAEYLPPTVKPRPFTSAWVESDKREQLQWLQGRGSLAFARFRTGQQQYALTVKGSQAVVQFPLLNWPGWEARVDGQVVPIENVGHTGLMALTLTEGSHDIWFTLRHTPVRLLAEVVSLLALLGVGWISRRYWTRSRLRKLFIVGLLLLLWLVGLSFKRATVIEDRIAPFAQSWDFAQLGYLHSSPQGIDFSNGAHLFDYRLEEPLKVKLIWQDGVDGAQATISLVSPAITRHENAPVLSSQTKPVVAGEVIYELELPEFTPSGQYLIQLTFDDAQALTPSGQPRGDLFLEPIRFKETALPDLPAGENLAMQPLAVQVEKDRVSVQMAWWTDKILAENFNGSLRLTDQNGRLHTQFDTQPGYGYRPTHLWQTQQWQPDWLAIPIDEKNPLTVGESYVLTVQLYSLNSDKTWLLSRLGEVRWLGDKGEFRRHVPEFEMPALPYPVNAHFGTEINLLGYDITQSAHQLELTLYWQAQRENLPDYSHFVHLFNPDTEEIVAQHDGMPAQNTFPTSQWVSGEIVVDKVTLDLSAVPAGSYQLAVGLFANAGEKLRLVVRDDEGVAMPANRLILGSRDFQIAP